MVGFTLFFQAQKISRGSLEGFFGFHQSGVNFCIQWNSETAKNLEFAYLQHWKVIPDLFGIFRNVVVIIEKKHVISKTVFQI